MNKRENKSILYKGQHLCFVRKGKWEYIERVNAGGAVIILATTNDQKVIFVEQYRPPVGKKVVEFPAGLRDRLPNGKLESVISAAKRELLEETGYLARELRTILVGPASSGLCSEMLTVMRARQIKKVAPGGGNHFESIKVHEIPILKVEGWLNAMRKRGYLVSPRIYAGLYLINKYNKILAKLRR